MAGRRHAARRASDGAHAAAAAGRRRDAKNDARRAGVRRDGALAGERHLSAFRVATDDDAASLGAQLLATPASAARALPTRPPPLHPFPLLPIAVPPATCTS